MLGDEYSLAIIQDSNKVLDLLDHHSPELVFLDLHMPKPNGLELLATIKEKGLETKVVIVTALAQQSYQDKAEEYGVYRYLYKPFDVDEILKIAHSVIH